jgi:Kef-type K+ transport system membrane component KefB
VVPYLDASAIIGSANIEVALLLVFATAVAIASIPVISRIMLDLGIMQTSFARVVIATAIVDDLVLYIVLAVAVGLTQTTPAAHSVPTSLVSDAASLWSPFYHVAATLLMMAFFLVVAPHYCDNYSARVVPGLSGMAEE